jgi:hypothetical protein
MKDYKKEVLEVDKIIRELTETRCYLMLAWIDAEHPLQVNGYVKVNRGGYKGRTMLILSRSVRRTNRGWEWVARGAILKRNNSPGTRRGEWFEPIDAKEKTQCLSKTSEFF